MAEEQRPRKQHPARRDAAGQPGGGRSQPRSQGSGQPRSQGSGQGRGQGGGARGARGGSTQVQRGPGAWKADRSDDGRRRRPIPAAPDPDPDATLDELDRSTRSQLRTLPAQLADDVGRHLVMVGRLLDEDPETAYLHAAKAQALAARVGTVREVFGLAAYRTGRWAQALSELRAARRLGGHDDLLPLIADCERALGRPERALSLAAGPEVARLDRAAQVELLIVSAGARRDLGQPEAAVVALQVKELEPRQVQPWTARLRFAYADALAAAGREAEARTWFARAAQADEADETDAAQRLAELEGRPYVPGDGMVFEDALDGEEPRADEQG